MRDAAIALPAVPPETARAGAGAAWHGRLGRLGAILLADLRQRTRSTRFRVTLALAALAAWWCFPPLEASYMIVAIGDHFRGRYSSAWIGMVLAMTTTLWSLIGFYVVRGTVQRDFETRVWQLLGTTSMTRAGYLLAKWASHVLVLGSILGTTMVVGLAAQWVRAEDRHLDLWELVKPCLFIALPVLALVATFAIWFDLVPRLRHTAGGVLFFFVWMTLLTAGAADYDRNHRPHRAPIAPAWTSDLPGIGLMQRAVDRQVMPQFPGIAIGEGVCIGCGSVDHPPRRFSWPRWEVAPAMLWGRVLWFALALGGVLLAVPVLDRLAARTIAPPVDTRGTGREPRKLRWLRTLLRPLQGSAFGTLVAAEAFVVLRMRAAWWWAAWLAAWIAQLFAPAHGAALAVLAAWTLLLDVFSRAGLREREHGTAALVMTAPGADRRLLRARIALAVGLGWVAALPALATHPAIAPLALAIGAALALCGLASGAATLSRRPFELVFLVLAYATTQGLPWLDASTHAAGVLSAHACTIAIGLVVLRWRWGPALRKA